MTREAKFSREIISEDEPLDPEWLAYTPNAPPEPIPFRDGDEFPSAIGPLVIRNFCGRLLLQTRDNPRSLAVVSWCRPWRLLEPVQFNLTECERQVVLDVQKTRETKR